MPTANGTVAGNDVILSVNGVPVGCSKTASLQVDREVLEAVCKESGGNREIALGIMSWSMSTENIFKIGSAVNWENFFNFLKNKQLIQVSFGTNVTGDKVFVGQGYVPSFNLDADSSDIASFGATIEGSGDLFLSTLSSPY